MLLSILKPHDVLLDAFILYDDIEIGTMEPPQQIIIKTQSSENEAE